MREPEGIETPLPGKSSERSWSKRREPDIRNVEAEGSSPFTSTRSPVQRAKVGSPRRSHSPTCLCVSLIGHMRSKWGPYRDLIRLLFFHHMSDPNEPRRDEPMMTMSLPSGLRTAVPGSPVIVRPTTTGGLRPVASVTRPEVRAWSEWPPRPMRAPSRAPSRPPAGRARRARRPRPAPR